ncbi:MAG: IS3 family transposase [Patescibacteria group bacterium]|nr:IS3 family transposase [Patescibacteria group bacterium]
MKKIIRHHPAYGYRRITPELNEEYGLKVNHKLVQKLLNQWDLKLERQIKKPKPSVIKQYIVALGNRVNLVALVKDKGESIKSLDILYTDFTRLTYCQGQKHAWLMTILDHTSKTALGWAVGPTTGTQMALAALTQVKKTVIRLGTDLAGSIIHHDQDPVYTGYDWIHRVLLTNQAQISYALRGAKDNPEIESFHSRFKPENKSLLLDCQTLGELTAVVNERLIYYNTQRRHSSIGNKKPFEYLKNSLAHRAGKRTKRG